MFALIQMFYVELYIKEKKIISDPDSESKSYKIGKIMI